MSRPWMTRKPRSLAWRLARYRWEMGIYTPVVFTYSVREMFECGMVAVDGRTFGGGR